MIPSHPQRMQIQVYWRFYVRHRDWIDMDLLTHTLNLSQHPPRRIHGAPVEIRIAEIRKKHVKDALDMHVLTRTITHRLVSSDMNA
ncbi:hypothetical protein TNIN_32991 [Trichonephila inaurata madagascariensis]|uniref:Uncharacterized protein n=1 Tax=Trichonephila inaurata madagascariensis TaxID=2747483 RepID=A0A8X6Y2Z9_9ARAC|nr:hypothetical protein TNIN_32991 [Trichonephila inaurata madagascariensis]